MASAICLVALYNGDRRCCLISVMVGKAGGDTCVRHLQLRRSKAHIDSAIRFLAFQVLFQQPCLASVDLVFLLTL